MNYKNISLSLDYYSSIGYIYISDAPWTVGKNAYYATKPSDVNDISINIENSKEENKYMVASGEQSFIQMMLDGQQIKKAICVTPCFRAEKYNHWHRPYFMKSELINAHDVDEGHLLLMIHEASSFYETILKPVGGSIRIIKTDNHSFDIIEKDTRIELGSYGMRAIAHPDGKSKDIEWIYGTGCAEPRLSSVVDRLLGSKHKL